MQVRTISGLALLLAAAAAGADDTVFATSFERLWVGGYHVGYQRNLYPTAEIDFSAVTHAMVGRITPNANGSINTHFDIDNVTGPATNGCCRTDARPRSR